MKAEGSRDEYWMNQALLIAKQGEYTVRSNPLVGCVLVKEDSVVGEGLHWQRGGPHAEIHALAQARGEAKGATAYVTLEPCAHTGLTGPCVDALIEAGITRVVLGTRDPDPRVSGKGIAALTAAGVAITEGVLASDAYALNKGFFSRMQRQRPYVRAKVAMSLDGRVAMKSGESQWITSALAREDVHRWRARSGAILSTAATVIADNAQLTVRGVSLDLPPGIVFLPPTRVIIDSHRRLSPQASFFQAPGEIVRAVLKEKEHVYDHVFPAKEEHVDIAALLTWMGEEAINDVWVEAGPTLLGALLQGEWIDEWIIYVAPKWLGHEAMPMAWIPGLQVLSEHISAGFGEIAVMGPDLRVQVLMEESNQWIV